MTSAPIVGLASGSMVNNQCQRVRIVRFAEEKAAACGPRRSNHVQTLRPAQQNHGNFAGLVIVAEPLTKLDPVSVREFNVEQNQMRLQAFGRLQNLLARI